MKTVRMREVMVSVLFFLMILSAMGLTLPRALADDGAVDNIEITVNISCSMTGTVTGGHTETMMNGETSQIGGTTTLKTVCNDNSGYAIYAIGYTDNEYGKTVLTDHSLDSSYDIVTSSTINSSISSWAMKLATSGSSYVPIIVGSSADSLKEASTPDYTAYQAVPSEYAKVVYYTSSTDAGTSALGSSVVATYRAYVSWLQPAGTYIGQVKYTLVHPSTASEPVVPLKDTDCPAGYVCYAPNANDIEGSMATLGAITSSNKAGRVNLGTSATTANLIVPNYKRSGYGFAGWSTSFDATVATNPVIYGPNETITVNLSSSGLILYPVWIASAGNLQSWTGCSGLTPASYNAETGALTATLSSVTALTDTRDGNVYTVARLTDGQCWMVENLRLNAEDTRGEDNVAKAQGYYEGVKGQKWYTSYGEFIGLADSEDANFNNNDPPIANTMYSVDGSNNTIDIGTTDTPYVRIPRYNNNNTNIISGATNADGVTSLVDSYYLGNNYVRWYGYGNYYNWPAAIASTKKYTTYNGASGSDAAGTSICPTGWHLPLGYESTGTLTGTVADDNLDSANRVGSYSYLDRRMGGTGAVDSTNSVTTATMSTYWRKFPNNFVYSGSWSGAQAAGRGSSGYYYSSSASGSYDALSLYLGSSVIQPGVNYGYKYHGYSVRCLSDS